MMCRMMAVASVGPLDGAMLRRFRRLADEGLVSPRSKPGHGDGWGMTMFRRGKWDYLGREPLSAMDPSSGYEGACHIAEEARSAGIVMVHLRKASKGSICAANSHPFVRGRWCLAHNGTILGYAKRDRTDSETLFLEIVGDLERGIPADRALAGAVDRVTRSHGYTSVTLLFSDGASVYGVRKVKDRRREPFYTLMVARDAGRVVVAQEPTWEMDWTELRNGEMVHLRPDLSWSVRPLVDVLADAPR